MMDVFGQRSANSALLHYHHPVSQLHSQTHTGVFPLTHYTSETNQGWTAALITFLSAFCALLLSNSILSETVPSEQQLVSGTKSSRAACMYHLLCTLKVLIFTPKGLFQHFTAFSAQPFIEMDLRLLLLLLFSVSLLLWYLFQTQNWMYTVLFEVCST